MSMLSLSDTDPMARAYLALPATGRGPGVLVLHAWWGLNDVVVEVCDRLARAGFIALAPDLYQGAVARTQERARELMSQMQEARTTEVIRDALERLLVQEGLEGDQVGVLGFSMGGAWGIALTTIIRPEPVGAIVAFYGNMPAFQASDFVNWHAAFLGHFAEEDEFESLETVRETQAKIAEAGKEGTFYIYSQTRHWFFEKDRPEYDAESARIAWDRTIEFFNLHIG